jgi:hypothetical protein
MVGGGCNARRSRGGRPAFGGLHNQPIGGRAGSYIPRRINRHHRGGTQRHQTVGNLLIGTAVRHFFSIVIYSLLISAKSGYF